MRRVLLGSLLLTCGLVLSGAAGPSPADGGDRTATGKGTLRFGHENNGRAMFEFEINGDGARPVGNLLLAAEAHDALYPDIIVRADEFHAMQFKGRQVVIKGEGHFHDEHILFTLTIFDGAGSTKADRFSFKSVVEHGDDDGGHHDGNLHIEADLWSGDIQIGTPN